jgi:hypothetical protein
LILNTSGHLVLLQFLLNGSLLKVYQPLMNFFLGGRFFQGTEMILAEAVSDTEDPRGNFRRIPYAVQLLLDPDKGLLNEVVGDGLVLYRGEDEFPHSVVVLVMNSE